MDGKLVYLIKTLSRTKRKDYENYVINSIWNKINEPNLVPVTQQCIRKKNGGHFFIDLYFPQLNIGVECDEEYHNSLENKLNDIEREITIFDILKQVEEKDYIARHIKITDFENVESQIAETVEFIKEKIKSIDISDGWGNKFIKPKDYFKEREIIDITDDIGFEKNCDCCNTIFNKRYKGSVAKGRQKISDNCYAWFPKLAIDGKAVSSGWNNTISTDGKMIFEFNEDKDKNSERINLGECLGEERVVFAQVVNPVTRNKEYRFVGVFKAIKYDEKGRLVYERISESFKIIR